MDTVRFQFKKPELLLKAIILMLSRGWKININNKQGDVLYVWEDGSNMCWLSHWTSDNPIHQVSEENFEDFDASIQQRKSDKILPGGRYSGKRIDTQMV